MICCLGSSFSGEGFTHRPNQMAAAMMGVVDYHQTMHALFAGRMEAAHLPTDPSADVRALYCAFKALVKRLPPSTTGHHPPLSEPAQLADNRSYLAWLNQQCLSRGTAASPDAVMMMSDEVTPPRVSSVSPLPPPPPPPPRRAPSQQPATHINNKTTSGRGGGGGGGPKSMDSLSRAWPFTAVPFPRAAATMYDRPFGPTTITVVDFAPRSPPLASAASAVAAMTTSASIGRTIKPRSTPTHSPSTTNDSPARKRPPASATAAARVIIPTSSVSAGSGPGGGGGGTTPKTPTSATKRSSAAAIASNRHRPIRTNLRSLMH